ncbi:hypothetical protein BFF78_01225 [Streptomyces fodineus]|uniref:Uncharacterized protein n=1 Tax=Streptomyces fodineus TaxID=1904616 RepID=A0A1D7Y2T2_9ACTN|nr:hypothetical protein BFF78_01225 [Streptomyces fodineus]
MTALGDGRPPPADQRAAEAEQSFMDVVAYLPADVQAAKVVQEREGTLDDPPLGGQARAVLGV